jgi:Tfp pilus assembly protein PilO
MTARRFRFDIRQAGIKLIVILSLLLIVNIGFYLAAVRPVVAEFGELSGDKEPQITLAKRTKVVEAVEKFVNGLHQAEADLETLRTDILSTREKRMVAVDIELAKLCADFNIDLDGVRYQNEMLDAEGIERFGMVVPLQGGYQDLRKFLQAVESSQKFLLVEQVDLGASKEGRGQLQLNITLATYFEIPEALKRRRVGGRTARNR